MGVLHVACLILLLKATSGFRCGPNSHFNVSATACPITCENKDNPPICNLGCVPRCECNAGYVLDNLGNCVRECDCRIACGPNSRFNPYAPGCPATCANKELRKSCKKAPVARCECIPGYILNHEGNCIRECDCPSCGPNERFNPVASGCPVTCENRGIPNLCTEKPRPRCECVDGYVLDVNGVCVAEGSCPRCGPNSRYLFCGSDCPRTCENKGLDLVCNRKCVPRCVCNKGYVLDHLGNCIKECECPSCPANSHFEPKASACQVTCENKDSPIQCNLGVKPGCVCNAGFVLDINGVCVSAGSCPRCQPNAVFRFNVSACVRTCENKDAPKVCHLGYEARCICKPGFILNHKGECILEANCPSCPPNSIFKSCASACPLTCVNKGPIACTKQCVARCDCKPGYVLDHEGNCILERNCPRCRDNEVFNPRASVCVRTCQNLLAERDCTLGYQARCQCARGYVMNHEGICILERNCPSCQANAHFEPLAPACLRTCENMLDFRHCTLGKKARCVCDAGFVLDHNGVCILEGNCPRCGPNQVFNPRASACVRTCANKHRLINCKLGLAKPRCECIRGFVLDHDGNCIAERNCPSCAANAHFEPHASACVRTCQNKNAAIECTLGFKSRCVCDLGFILDHNGVCILESNCPRCGPNQIFNPLASACVRTCQNMNALRKCQLGFKPMCQCVRGFVLDHDGNCIAERNCPSCPNNSHFEPHASACVRTCQNLNAVRECTLGFKSRCVCNTGFILDHNGVCILEGNCPRCGPNQVFNPRSSVCVRTCENKNVLRECSLGVKAKCECKRGFVLDHDGNCILERNCPSCAENSHFEPHAIACVRTCENMNALIQCTLGFKARCVCDLGFVRDHNGVCILEGNCPRCGPNQIFNPRASACACSCENPNASKNCKLGSKARCQCIRGYVLDHEGNCIDERNCPRCQENAHFQPRAPACIRTCENMNALVDCTLGVKARCVCNKGYILDHNGVCIREANCPRCGPNQIFNPRASACVNTCENPTACKECKLGVKARCACIRGYVLDHEGNCIDERNCPRCQENAQFQPRASACVRTCENMNAIIDCTLGIKARCVCNKGYILDHNGVCIREANCPRCGPNQIFNPRASACLRTCQNPNADKECKLGLKARCECARGYVLDHEGNCIDERSCPRCQEYAHFEPRASACSRSCENMNALVDCTLGFKARCVCDKGYILDHNGVCISEANCPRCGPNEIFNPRASACLSTCENPNASKECKLGAKARCDCIRGYVLDHNGVCIPESSCPRCGPNEIFNPHASACLNTCENPNASNECKLGAKARCDCVRGYVLDHNGVCIPESSCPRCGPNEYFNPRASACACSCENPNASKECKLGAKARCQCIRGYVLDHNGVCIPETNCIRCGLFEVFNPRASGCVRTCDNRNAIGQCSSGIRARCECIPGYVLDHKGDCVRENKCPICGPNSHFNPRASACAVTCKNQHNIEECTLGTEARCECDNGFVLDDNGVCIKSIECIKCAPHSHFNPQASACPITCDNFDQVRQCHQGLVARCECDDGYILHPNGNCVKQCDCPVKCPLNSHYNNSASACPITCRNKDNPPMCNLPNVARCQCDHGFVLNAKGVCIPECDCQPTCGANEHYSWCAPVVPITCKNRNSPREFSENCVARCECNDGYILNSEGKCVKECECKECGPNAHFTDCVSNCPRTCTNLNDVLMCTKECRSGGCECDEGFVFDNYGNCVREHDCPDPRCGRHAFFSHHLPNIQITCANRHQRRDVEFSYCSEGGCRCKSGYVLDAYSNCILESDCPK